MKRLAVLALALTAAACGSAGVPMAKSVAVLPLPDPVVVTAPLLPPANGIVLYHADPKCPPSVATVALPDKAVRDCYALRARLALVSRLLADHVEPGDASPCAQFLSPQSFASCLDIEARKLPAQAYGLSGQWTSGLLQGKPWSGCASGIAYREVAFASLAEPARVMPLVAWEAGNNFLGYTFDRMDLTDGPLISAATTAAKAACGETDG